MTRVITVADDETDTTARIEITRGDDGHVVRRIVVETEADSGLPDEIVSALIPYIGLPALRSPNGRSATRDTGTVPAAAFVAPREDDDTARAIPAQRPYAGKPSLHPALQAAPQPTARPSGSGVRKYNKPSDEDLEAAISQVGARPKILAEHYNVPVSAINNWLYAWRKRTAPAKQ